MLNGQLLIKKAMYIILYMTTFCAGIFQFGSIVTEKAEAPENYDIPVITEISDESSTNEVEVQLIRRYYLTDYERSIVESVVMAEAGAEPFEGQMAVAQCILNAAEYEDMKPSEIVTYYQYAKTRPEATDEVKRAVSAVFDDGDVTTEEKILYFYAPAISQSSWHEEQDYVMTIGGHRFFTMKGEMSNAEI